MNCRVLLVALLFTATALVVRSPASAAAPVAGSPAAVARTASLANERSFPTGDQRSFRSFGVLSGAEENEVGDTEPDSVFNVPRRRFGPTPSGATASGATAGDGPRTDATTQSGGQGGSRGSAPLREHPQVEAIIAEVLAFFRNREVSVSLLHGHKYMVNDCLGLKVSAGEFRIRFADPRLGFVGDKLVFECGLEHVSFSQFKIRMRPRVPSLSDPNPCHFSKKFELGGSADDVRLKVTFDPVVNHDTCRVALGKVDITVRIGNLDLKPLQNNLDDMAKNMVEDALSVFLDMALVPDMFDRIEYLVQVGCGGTGGGDGGSSGSSGGGNNADLERRVGDLEARVAALEQNASASPASAAASPATTEPAGRAAPESTESARPASPASPRGPATTERAAPRTAGQTRAFQVVANPELKGRLGRIVVTFPAGVKDPKARTGIAKAGDSTEVRAAYGNIAVEMTPGTYDVTIGGRTVSGVVVESRSDSIVAAGVLRLHGNSGTRFGLFAPGDTRELQAVYGENDLGLPVGTFEVEVNGQREAVTITAGEITEY